MNNVKEFRDLDLMQLSQKVQDMRRELLSIRLQAATTPIKDFTQFKKLRRNIARAMTILREKVVTESGVSL